MISKGYKVAICEQVEDPKKAKGIVKRAVVRVVTPGTVIDALSSQPNSRYLMAIWPDLKKEAGRPLFHRHLNWRFSVYRDSHTGYA